MMDKTLAHKICLFMREQGVDDKEMARLGWDDDARETVEAFAFLITEARERIHDRMQSRTDTELATAT